MSAFETGDQSDDSDIICPHCGASHQAEPCDGDASEDPSERECNECGKVYVLYASVSITYHTTMKKEVRP